MTRTAATELESERLILRSFRLDDATAMYENWASDPAVTRYLGWLPHKCPNESQELIRSWFKMAEDPGFYEWAIDLKGTCMVSPVLIGSIGGRLLFGEQKVFEVGYSIGTRWWNQGLTTEALQEVIRYMLEEVGVDEVRCEHDVLNPRSGSVMKRCGMVCRGESRLQETMNEQSGRILRYSITADARRSEREP